MNVGNYMQEPVKARVARMGREIAEIQEANRNYSDDTNSWKAENDRMRRFQRLREILNELKTLTAWKAT